MLTPTELRLQDAILENLVSTYRTHSGQEVQGQSISFLSQELRDSGWKGVSNLNDLESTCQNLGFKMVEAQLVLRGKARRFARVVTL
jgi:hypothetical protein